jgi:short-subunit dehydrogenase
MKKNVLITGCSSGLGRALTLQLADQNFQVFSSVRNEAEAETLKGLSENIEPVIMDVTNHDQITAVYHQIDQRSEHGLYALINNAAAMYVTPFEWASEDKMRNVYEVNLFAPIKIIKLFLPLIKKFALKGNRGKVINVASWAGLMPSPWTSFYSSSKSALIGISEGIFHELHTQEIDVIAVIAGLMKTPFLSKTASEVAESLEKARKMNLYEKELAYLDKLTQKTNKSLFIPEPEKISKHIARILKKKKPRHRYMLGLDSKFVHLLTRFTPFGLRRFMLKNMYQLK